MGRDISVRQGEVRGTWGPAMMFGATLVRHPVVPVTANVAKPVHHRAGHAKTNRVVHRKPSGTEIPVGDLP